MSWNFNNDDESNKYLEDTYGTEIKKGDTYYQDDYGHLIHKDNAELYLQDNCFKKIR